MSNSLGKRKRRGLPEKEVQVDNEQSSRLQYLALMKQHFEDEYQPLESSHSARPQSYTVGKDGETELSDYDDDEDDRCSSDTSELHNHARVVLAHNKATGPDWEGFSDDEGDPESNTPFPAVEVVDHSTQIDANGDEHLLVSRKSFMSSKLPSDEEALKALRRVKTAPEDGDPSSEASLMANDNALQRLLRESKLLLSNGVAQPDSSLELAGKFRHQAVDAQMRSLGAKTSLQAQKSMPRAQRMGIIRKAAERESTRRKEAREAGVILEKERRVSKEAKRRDRGVGAPGVGKFRGGTLKLSAKDVRSIQGTPARRGRGKRGRR